MSDIVERLTILHGQASRESGRSAVTAIGPNLLAEVLKEAADEIVRLRKEHTDRVRERDEAIETCRRIASQFSSLLALIGQIYVGAEKDRKEAGNE